MSRLAQCGNPLCRCAIPRWKQFCDACWKRLPFPQRKAMRDAQAAHRFAAVTELAIAAGAWLRDHNPAAEAARRLGEGGA